AAVIMEAPRGGPTSAGFDNRGGGLKYVFLKRAETEMLLSGGFDVDVGGTGQERVGAEPFSTFTPSLFFGKGMGDLPDGVRFLKPFALTGALGLALPVRTEPRDFQCGITTQYRLQHLQHAVPCIGLPQTVNRV